MSDGLKCIIPGGFTALYQHTLDTVWRSGVWMTIKLHSTSQHEFIIPGWGLSSEKCAPTRPRTSALMKLLLIVQDNTMRARITSHSKRCVFRTRSPFIQNLPVRLHFPSPSSLRVIKRNVWILRLPNPAGNLFPGSSCSGCELLNGRDSWN